MRRALTILYNSISLGASVKKELSRIGGMKAFPQNIVVKAFLTTQVTEGTESVPLTVETTTNIVLLPKVPMTPRFADRRVGFFTTPHIYFNDKQQAVETREFCTSLAAGTETGGYREIQTGRVGRTGQTDCILYRPATPVNGGRRLKPVFLIGRKLLKLPVLKMRL